MVRLVADARTLVLNTARTGGLMMALAVSSGPALADAGDFLKGLEGSYVGKGTATIGAAKQKQRVGCKLNTTFSSSKKALSVVGNCASTQGKRKVSGRISYSGNNVKGTLLSSTAGYQVTQSSGSIKGKQMVISVSLMDNRVNKLVRGRQVLTKTGNGFKSVVYRFDNKSGKFVVIGSMNFRKK